MPFVSDEPGYPPRETIELQSRPRQPRNSGLRAMKLYSRSAYAGQPKPEMDRKMKLKLLWSYAPDWIITIGLAAIFFALDLVPGFKREFSLDDLTLRYPYAVHERVPPIALYFIAIVAPFVFQSIINYLTIRSWWDFHNSTLGLILGLAMTGAVTQFSKITVGRPRPDVIDRCQPIPGMTDPLYRLSNYTICTQTDNSILKDGFRSFPSGHSSLSFAGLGFLTFYMAGKLHLWNTKGHVAKAWLALAPLSAAALVAISRTMDYRHHWQDVLTGSILGFVMAYFAYRQYYPHLGSELCHRPYSPRIKHEEDEQLLPTHHRRVGSSDAMIGGEYTRRGGMKMHQHESESRSRYRDSESELEEELVPGTVKRPRSESLEDVWKEGGPSEYGVVDERGHGSGSGGS